MSCPGGTPWAMHPIVIEIPELVPTAESEAPIGRPDQVRLYIGPDIELVMTPATADRVVDALIEVRADDGRPVVRVPAWAL